MIRQTPCEPYPGLRPYRETEKGNFFGRETDAAILIDKILTNRFTLLFAASGVGKSSLLQAAVIPRLKSSLGENLVVVYHSDWVSEPVQTVKAAVLTALQTKEAFPQDLELAEEDLYGLLSLAGVFVRPPLVLILDQFEEFFRYQRATRSFNEFIDQLVAVLADKSLAVSLMFSMREDFALELNAFKNKLPTLLFENFYRLEKLNRDNTLTAIKAPVEQLGYQYEPRLLEWLLADLLNREYDYRVSQSIAEIRMTAEPPYLQIVCAQLWELNKNDPEKTIRLVSYEKAGRAQGIVKNYIQDILSGFYHAEKQLASKAFDHLIGQRGVKIAYTAKALAEIGRLPEQDLAKVLDKLETVRVLRRQQRGEEVWFELYHDLFSRSLEAWNKAWKDHMRFRRAMKWLTGGIVATLLIVSASDFAINRYSYHFRLGKEGISDRIELWQGTSPNGHWLFDFFHQRQYIAETDFTHSDLEPDKRFEKKGIDKYKELVLELIEGQSSEQRIESYVRYGIYRAKDDRAALPLAKKLITTGSLSKADEAIKHVASVNTPEAAKFIYDIANTTNSDNLRKLIYLQPMIQRMGVGIALTREGLRQVIKPELLSDEAKDFWQYQLSLQVMNEHALDYWLDWGVTDYVDSLVMVSGNDKLNQYLIKNLREIKILNESEINLLGLLQVKEAIPELVNRLESYPKYSLSSIVESLVALQAQEAVKPLIELVKERDDRDILSAIAALAFFKADSASPVLISILQDLSIDSSIRVAAIKALVELNSKQVFLYLIKALQDDEAEVRRESLRALSVLEPNKSLEYSLLLLRDRDSSTREVAAENIKKLINEDLLSNLLNILNEEDEFLGARIEAVNILADFKYEKAKYHVLELLKRFSKNDYSEFRLALLSYLASLNELSIVPDLFSLLDMDSSSVVKDTLKKIDANLLTPILLSVLKSSDKKHVVLAIEVLDEFGIFKESYAGYVVQSDYEVNLALSLALSNIGKKLPDTNIVKTLQEYKKRGPLLDQRIDNLGVDFSSNSELITTFIKLAGDEDIVFSTKIKGLLKKMYIKKALLIKAPQSKAGIPMAVLSEIVEKRVFFDAIFLYPELLDTKYDYGKGSFSILSLKDLDNKNTNRVQQLILAPSFLEWILNENITQQFGGVVKKIIDFDCEISIPFLLRLIKNGNAHIQKNSILAMLALQELKSLNPVQAQLLTQALSLSDPVLLEEAKQEWQAYKKTQVEPALSESAKRFNAMTNEELTACIADADVKMTEWRAQREADLLKVVDTFELVPPNTAEAYRSWQVFQCAFDLSKREPNEGKKLLMHNLFDVREAAAMGMASSMQLKVSDIKELEQQWLATKDPIRHNAIFRAIDLGLLNIEAVGQDSELAELNQYLAELKQLKPFDDEVEHPSQVAIFPRVDWTQAQLQWRSETLKQNIQAYNEQLPGWLKEYCLNSDGSYMQPEHCEHPKLKALLPTVSSAPEVQHD